MDPRCLAPITNDLRAMDYGLRIMGCNFGGNQLGSTKKLWNRGEYGLWELWMRGESTVVWDGNTFWMDE